MKRAWLAQFAGNAVLLFLIWEWLGIRDARAWQLALTASLGLIIIAGTLWLHAATFHWFASRDWRVPLRRILIFAGALALFLLLAWGLDALPLDRWSVWTGSILTFKSRKPVNPATVLRVMQGVRWFLKWIVLPVLLLPVAAGKPRQSLRPRFWLQYIAAVVICFWLPGKLIHWTPRFEATVAQVVSFLFRFGIAYCLAVTGWLALAFFSSGGRPAATQPSTAPLP